MRLSDARLCLDCEEVHDQGRCPICASESFAFIRRWVTTPEKRGRPVVADQERSETIATYRELLDGNGERRLTAKQLLRGGAVGLAMLGAGWLLQKNLRDRVKGDATGSSAAKDRTPGTPPAT
jgi:RNA polymerase subunit RPABC4/transcription elongation factor Spt4